MNKIIAFLILSFLLYGVGWTQGLTGMPIVTTNDSLIFQVQALDSIGLPRYPDSIHVLVFAPGTINASVYSASDTAPYNAAGDWIDSVSYAGSWHLLYRNKIDNIDLDNCNGLYTGEVRCFYHTVPTDNPLSFYKIGTGVQNSYAFAVARAESLRVNKLRIDSRVMSLSDDTANIDLNGTTILLSSGTGTGQISLSSGAVITTPADKKASADTFWLADTSEYASNDDSTMAGLSWRLKQIKTKTDNLPSDPADQSLIMDEIGNINGWNPVSNDSILSVVREIQAGLGWGDGWESIYYLTGSANKDSLRMFHADTVKATIYIKHTGAVVDSSRFEKW